MFSDPAGTLLPVTMSASYIRQQYGNAVATLCTHPGRVRERLELAVTQHLIFAADPGPDVPPLLASLVTDLHTRLTSSAPAVADEGTAAASIRLLTEDQAGAAAREVLELDSHLASAYYQPEHWSADHPGDEAT